MSGSPPSRSASAALRSSMAWSYWRFLVVLLNRELPLWSSGGSASKARLKAWGAASFASALSKARRNDFADRSAVARASSAQFARGFTSFRLRGMPSSTAPQPFSPQEHARFVEGVEQYCRAHAGEVGGDACWAAIASHVQNRSADELKAHAQYYLMSLQSRSPELARAPTPVIWTAEENAYFEAQLAVVDEGSPQRFATIAAGLPDKSEDDVRAWYEKLLGDLLEIERGARA